MNRSAAEIVSRRLPAGRGGAEANREPSRGPGADEAAVKWYAEFRKIASS
jgi:hypothetical protein